MLRVQRGPRRVWKTMSFNVLKMSRKVLSTRSAADIWPPRTNTKWHAWLFSCNKSFSGNYSYLRKLSPHTNYTRLRAFLSVHIWERERERAGGKKKLSASNCHIKHTVAQFDETIMFFLCKCFLLNTRGRKLTSDLWLSRMTSCILPVFSARPLASLVFSGAQR